MPRQDDLSFWQSLLEQFEVMPVEGNLAPPPTAAELDRFEAEFKFRLPTSYRGFVQVFGAGYLEFGGTDISILAPYVNNISYDIKNENFDFDPERMESEDQGEDELYPVRLERSFLFGNSSMGDHFLLDPQVVTDVDNSEYEIIALIRADEDVTPLARTFREFIELFLNTTEFHEKMRIIFDPEKLEEAKTPRFVPATISE